MIAVVTAAAALAGCGAPTKSASSVAGLFTANAVSLATLEQTVCTDLASRSSAPSTQLIGMNLQGCQNAGLAALDYTKITAFEFADITGDAPSTGGISGTSGTSGTSTTATPPAAASTSPGTASSSLALDNPAVAQDSGSTQAVTNTTSGSGSTISRSFRAEVWLNRGFLDLAGQLTAYMQAQGSATVGQAIKLPDSSTQTLANLVTPNITVSQVPVLDLTNLSFTLGLNLQTTGLIAINNTFQMVGQLLDNAFAITIATAQDQPYSASLVKDFKATVIVVPYANDVYLDLFIDVDLYSVGLQSIFDQQINAFLSTGLKGIIDSLIVVQGSAG